MHQSSIEPRSPQTYHYYRTKKNVLFNNKIFAVKPTKIMFVIFIVAKYINAKRLKSIKLKEKKVHGLEFSRRLII